MYIHKKERKKDMERTKTQSSLSVERIMYILNNLCLSSVSLHVSRDVNDDDDDGCTHACMPP